MTMEKFHWNTPAGAEIVLPRMGKIKAGIIRKIRNADDVDAMFTLLEAVADEDTLAKIDDLEADDLNELFRAWQGDTSSSGESGSSSI